MSNNITVNYSKFGDLQLGDEIITGYATGVGLFHTMMKVDRVHDCQPEEWIEESTIKVPLPRARNYSF